MTIRSISSKGRPVLPAAWSMTATVEHDTLTVTATNGSDNIVVAVASDQHSSVSMFFGNEDDESFEERFFADELLDGTADLRAARR